MREVIEYTFDRLPNAAMGVPRMCVSRFVAADDGRMEHYTDDRLRATVPPEGFDAYAAAWPACAPIVAELRGRPAAVQTVFIGVDAIDKGAADRARTPVAPLDPPVDAVGPSVPAESHPT